MIERVWLLLVAAVMCTVIHWGAAPKNPHAPWQFVQLIMWAAVIAAVCGVVWPKKLFLTRASLIGAAFLGRAAVVSVGVIGFPRWQSTVIATGTYALLGVSSVLLQLAWAELHDHQR
jgi:multidrug efflux pump subunit AcrA (membrane-fusion protein)